MNHVQVQLTCKLAATHERRTRVGVSAIWRTVIGYHLRAMYNACSCRQQSGPKPRPEPSGLDGGQHLVAGGGVGDQLVVVLTHPKDYVSICSQTAGYI
ncbi:hypothetical protein ACLOJK_032312 [Asimina triloba]